MKIVLMHYHLDPGGVTTVIRQQIEALKDHADLLLIAGRLPSEGLPIDAFQIPALNYSTEQISQAPPETTARKILKFITAKWPDGCDLIHVHNPLLAKNLLLLDILLILQANGQRLFLQIHDFAEDGRPAVHYGRNYPADCHYCVINHRDYRILKEAGLDARGLHLVPNAVRALVPAKPTGPIEPFILYPVRGLRRKNIGEAILLSILRSPPLPLAITLPPSSPQDLAAYHDWRSFCGSLGLDVRFDQGRRYTLPELLDAAHSVLTTSIGEGFGLAFLEPWTSGKFLWGRRLAGICDDFEAEGIQLEHLYDKLNIPMDCFDVDEFRQRWTRCLVDAYRRSALPIDDAKVDAAWESVSAGSLIDFGILAESMQRNIIQSAVFNPAIAQRLYSVNPWLQNESRIKEMIPTIDRNRRAVKENYSIARFRKNLLTAYARVISHDVRHQINRQWLLAHFLSNEKFSLLKWESYDR